MKHAHLIQLRRITTLLLALVLLIALVGCQKKENPGSTGDTQGTPSESTSAPTQTPAPETTEATTVPPTEEPTQAPTEAPTDPPQEGTMGTVTAKELNIREDAGSKYDSVGSYRKGDRIEILEIKGKWGRTDKGWVSMNYVKMDDDSEDPAEDNDPTEDTKPEEEETVTDGNTSAKGYGVVTLNSLNVRTGPGTKYEDIGNVTRGERFAYYQKSGNWVRIKEGWVSLSYFYLEGDIGEGSGTGTVIDADLNVRSGPGKDYERVGGLKKGDTVKILAQVNSWGYTGKGWVSMNYVKMDGTVSTGSAGTGVITGKGLNIRKEPSTDADVLGSYDKGDKVEILEVKGNWGRTSKGWISLDYVKMETGTGTVTASSLNIRKEANTDSEKVGAYEKGDTVKILEVKGDWGRTDKGWVNMKYVKMDG